MSDQNVQSMLERFTWRKTAEGTVEQYRALLDAHHGTAR